MEDKVKRQVEGMEHQVGEHVIRVGSRKSKLALIQTHLVIRKLEEFYENNPERWTDLQSRSLRPSFQVVAMSTTGDKILDKALPDIGTKSLFTRELEVELLEKRVDFVVHSLKDLPTTLPEGCSIGAILERDSPEDVIVLKKSLCDNVVPLRYLFEPLEVESGSRLKIGTSSHRRIAMVRRCNKSIQCKDIRGNLNTRLAKLDDGESDYAAIILAKAGLDRMGWSDRISSVLSPAEHDGLKDWLYAVGQGAIAVECRSNDEFVFEVLKPIVHRKTACEVVAERSLMRKLEAGCSVPLGVRSSWTSNNLTLESVVISLDGTKLVRASTEIELPQKKTTSSKNSSLHELGSITTGIVFSEKLLSNDGYRDDLIDCYKLGIDVANKMIDLGALELMSRDG